MHLHQRSLEKCGEYCCSLCYWLATLRVVECARLVYLIGIFTFTCILLVHEQMAFDSPILSVIPLNFDSLFHNLLHRVNGKVWRLQFLHPCFRPPLWVTVFVLLHCLHEMCIHVQYRVISGRCDIARTTDLRSVSQYRIIDMNPKHYPPHLKYIPHYLEKLWH